MRICPGQQADSETWKSAPVRDYRIMTYTDGSSALDGIKSSPPDLAILDIKMPRMDGMETLRRLRRTSAVPVIFLTSKNEEIDEFFLVSRWARTTSSGSRSRSGC